MASSMLQEINLTFHLHQVQVGWRDQVIVGGSEVGVVSPLAGHGRTLGAPRK